MNDHTVEIELLALEAATIFEAAGDQVHLRWLTLELKGYDDVPRRAPLHEVLGIPEGGRLAEHVSAYRVQRGQIMEGGEFTGRPFQHFFVEPLREISAASERARRGTAGPVRLDFRPDIPSYPVAAIFPTDVFERILLGFRAVLHLQLGTIAP